MVLKCQWLVDLYNYYMTSVTKIIIDSCVEYFIFIWKYVSYTKLNEYLININ